MQNAHSLPRREFLKTAAAFAASSALLGLAPRAAAAAAKPWTVAIRDGHLKSSGQPDCWSALKELGVSGMEVTVGEDLRCAGLYHAEKKYTLATADGIKALQDDLAAHGATITAFAMNNRLDERLDERLEQEVAWARRLVAAAASFGVTAIRIDVVPHKTPVGDFLPVATKACRALCDVAAGTPVRFAIENHGRITNDPAFTEKLFDGVGSAQLGLTLDAMNFYWFGHPLQDLYGIYEKFAPRVFHTHCKNLRYPADQKNVRRAMGWEYGKYSAALYDGDIDYRRVAAILRQANYQGDLCLENECLGHFPKDQHAAVLKKEIALLKTLA